MDEELDALRRKRLLELQRQQTEQEYEQQDMQIRQILRQILTQKARARLARLRLARPELVGLVERQIIMLAQSGKVLEMDDTMLKRILRQLTQKRDISIKRK